MTWRASLSTHAVQAQRLAAEAAPTRRFVGWAYNARVSFPVRAITLDLDDTLWPFAPIGARIEEGLHGFFLEHSPATAAQFPIAGMRELRTRVHADHPHLHHDLSALRRLTIERALRESGADPALAERAYLQFHRHRNTVDFYPDALEGLRRIAARVPVVAVSNGNADLAAIGIADLFAAQLSALMHGVPKPSACIFHAACALVDVKPEETLHVGDDAEMDTLGAARAGLRTCWLHRGDKAGEGRLGDDGVWPAHEPAPDLQFDSLIALADWLDANACADSPRTYTHTATA
jgi:HAD superfamily hydrolase (TIGR01509 family)